MNQGMALDPPQAGLQGPVYAARNAATNAYDNVRNATSGPVNAAKNVAKNAFDNVKNSSIVKSTQKAAENTLEAARNTFNINNQEGGAPIQENFQDREFASMDNRRSESDSQALSP